MGPLHLTVPQCNLSLNLMTSTSTGCSKRSEGPGPSSFSGHLSLSLEMSGLVVLSQASEVRSHNDCGDWITEHQFLIQSLLESKASLPHLLRRDPRPEFLSFSECSTWDP